MAGQPDLTLEEMVRLVRKRVRVTNDDAWIVDELNDGQNWTWQRLYVTNPDVQLTFDTTGSLSSATQTLDLTTAVSSTIWGIKRIWFKGAADSEYVPGTFRDENDPAFIASEQITPAQVIHPVLVAVYNFNQLRFGNQLPSGTNWKIDWYGEPPKLSLQTNAANTTYPAPLNYPTLARAIAVIYDSIDDDRARTWFGIASERVSMAIRNVKRRQFATKAQTKPYPIRQGSNSWRPQTGQ